MTAHVYSANAGITVRLKAEDHTDPTRSVETEAVTTSSGWNSLVFDFANQASGTAQIDFTYTYDMLSIFYDFGNSGAGDTYYLDSVFFGGTITGTPGCTDPLASNFDASATTDDGSCVYAVTFNVDMNCEPAGSFTTPNLESPVYGWCGGCVPLADPDGDGVWSVTVDLPLGPFEYKYAVDAWAGQEDLVDDMLAGGTCAPITDYASYANRQVTIVAGLSTSDTYGSCDPCTTPPVTTSHTIHAGNYYYNPNYLVINVGDTVTWFNDGGFHDVNGDINSQTGVSFGNPVSFYLPPVSGPGTIGSYIFTVPGLYDYDCSIGNHASNGMTGTILVNSPQLSQIDLPITWDDPTVDYTVTDFGGTVSSLSVDPMDSTNSVLMTDKTAGAQSWAGTTLGNSNLASSIPFSSSETIITAKVYSPVSGINIRLKAEDHTNGGISVETEVTLNTPNVWTTLVFDFSNEVAGTAPLNFANTYDMLSIFYDFGNVPASSTIFYLDSVEFVVGGAITGCTDPTALNFDPSATLDDGSCTYTWTLSQIDLPISWDDTTVDYTVSDFGGNVSSVVTDPAGLVNNVLQSEKTPGAATWAGTTLGTPIGFATPIPFNSGATVMTAHVYSPYSGITVRLKAEDHTDPTKSVETEAVTTTANGWNLLVFDFANQAPGTAQINFSYTYDQLSIFYDFGNNGNGDIYYLDSVVFGGSILGVPGCTDPNATNYDPTATVDDGSCTYAPPTSGLSPYCDLLTYHFMNPAEVPSSIYLTIANNGPNSIYVEVESADSDPIDDLIIYSSTPGYALGTLTINGGTYSNDMTWSSPVDSVYINVLWSKQSFGGNWQLSMTDVLIAVADTCGTSSGTPGCTDPTALNYDPLATIDDGSCTYAPSLSQIDLPISWDDTTVDYTVSDFGGNASSVVADPAGLVNNVLQSEKTPGAQTWAGTTLGTASGFATAIPFASGATTMTAHVYAPSAGVTIKLKAEDSNDPTKSVETDVVTTTSGAWESLIFDFANQSAGTAQIDFTYTYDKLSIFYDFGNAGAGDIYYLDSVMFGGTITGTPGCTDPTALNYDPLATIDDGSCTYAPSLSQIDLPISWDDTTVDYTVSDFGGNASSVVADPAGLVNNVLQSEKTPGAQTWAGTTLGTASGFATAIPFASGATTMTAHVYAPSAGVTIKLKAEDSNDPTKSVETDVVTTTSGAWESLIFDFANQSAGTAQIDFTYTYDKLSIFYDFGNAGAGDIYYLDSVMFGGTITGTPGCTDPLASNYDSLATVDDGSCLYSVTFNVDMNCEPAGSFGFVHLESPLFGWCGGCVPMTDPDGDGVHSVTVDLAAGNFEYKYAVDNWGGQEDLVDDMISGGTCAPITDYSSYANRLVAIAPGLTTADTYGSCDACVLGCTDPLANNYDSLATTDDGSCTYCTYGCTDPLAFNYDSLATCDDGSCIPFVYGCTDTTAINYYPGANTDDGSCIYAGCTDPNATNYDPTASVDDGSCTYMNCTDPVPTGLAVNWVTDTKAEITWDNMNDSACMVLKYFVRYREVGTLTWTTKSAGVGNGLCNFGLNTTTKTLQNLTSSTTYEYKMKAFYCGGTSSNYSAPSQFTTADDCPPMTNLTATTFNGNQAKVRFDWDTTGAYVFARVALRVDTAGANWQTAGGFGVYYPTFYVNKFGLQPGESYRAQGRTFCDSNITSYRSWWTSPIFWTQPGSIRMNGGTAINNLDVYPNPTRDIFNVSFVSEEIQTLSIRVMNIVGEVIYEESLEEFVGEYTKQINLGDYSKGVYFLEINDTNGTINKKIILQ